MKITLPPITQGPWHIGIKPGPIVYGPQGEQVADFRVPMIEDAENKANAQATAALPDCLSALSTVFEASQIKYDSGALRSDLVYQAIRSHVIPALLKAGATITE